MPTLRRLVGQITACLLLIVLAAACSVTGPDLVIDIDNTDGPKAVTVTVDSSGLGMIGGEDLTIGAGEGAGVERAARVHLGSQGRRQTRHRLGRSNRPRAPVTWPPAGLDDPHPGRQGWDRQSCGEAAKPERLTTAVGPDGHEWRYYVSRKCRASWVRADDAEELVLETTGP